MGPYYIMRSCRKRSRLPRRHSCRRLAECAPAFACGWVSKGSSMHLRTTLLTLVALFAAHAAAPDGEALYKQRCATCHDGQPQARMPSRQELNGRTPESIYQAMF